MTDGPGLDLFTAAAGAARANKLAADFIDLCDDKYDPITVITAATIFYAGVIVGFENFTGKEQLNKAIALLTNNVEAGRKQVQESKP